MHWKALWIAAGFCLEVTISADATEVSPGGALDISISGFTDFLAAYGRLNRKPNLVANGNFRELSQFDFLSDAEVHFLAKGRHDATGIEYGAVLYMNASTCEYADTRTSCDDSSINSRETWVFVRGGFGEARFGDTDSAANNMKIGAYTVAVGTGGIDGKIVDIPQTVLVDLSNRSADPSETSLYATKAVYYSPNYKGFQLGISFTPTIDADKGSRGDALGSQPQNVTNEVAAGLSYTALLGPAAVRASIVGAAIADRPSTGVIYAGGAIDLGDFSIAGGAGMRNLNEDYTQGGHDLERPMANIGAQYRWNPFAFSVNYGWAYANQGPETKLKGRFSDLVLGAEVGLLPGLVLSTEVAYFSIKRVLTNDDNSDTKRDNDSWVGVTRLRLAF